jgi:hypothetical protein
MKRVLGVLIPGILSAAEKHGGQIQVESHLQNKVRLLSFCH